MNKAIRVSVLLLWLFFFGFCVFIQEAPAEGGLTKVADNVYSYVDVKGASAANSFGANAGIVIGRDGIVVIDTLTSSKEAKRFIDDIKAVSSKPIRYVVNTHYHLDHTFGNSEFAKLGAAIIANAECKAEQEKNSETVLNNAASYGFSKEDIAGTEMAYPVTTFNNRMEIDLGDQKIELIHVGPAHTGGDALVYLPDKKVLFAGDVLFTNYYPYMGEADLEGWIKALDLIANMDADKIIPGHGPVSSQKDVADMREYLIQFDRKALELCAVSSDPEYIASKIKAALPERAEGGWLIKASVKMKYMKVE